VDNEPLSWGYQKEVQGRGSAEGLEELEDLED